MLSKDKMRFKGTGTSQGPQGRDSSLTTFTFSSSRARDNSRRMRSVEKTRKTGEKMRRRRKWYDWPIIPETLT